MKICFGFEKRLNQNDLVHSKDFFHMPGTVVGIIRDTKIKQGIKSVGRDKHVNRFLHFLLLNHYGILISNLFILTFTNLKIYQQGTLMLLQVFSCLLLYEFPNRLNE